MRWGHAAAPSPSPLQACWFRAPSFLYIPNNGGKVRPPGPVYARRK